MIKYTKEKLEPIALKSKSVSDMLRMLGTKINGGNHKYLTRVIKKFNIDISHFCGYASARGKESFNRKYWDEILVLSNKDRRQCAYMLRRALVESGREYKCCLCGQGEIWNGRKIVLEVHHKNCNWLDNRKENLEFLCPNCHSQETQEKFKENKKKTKRIRKTKKCSDCNVLISEKAERCKCCARKLQKPKTKIVWPETEQLKEMVKNTSYCEVGRQLRVSDNAVRKRLK